MKKNINPEYILRLKNNYNTIIDKYGAEWHVINLDRVQKGEYDELAKLLQERSILLSALSGELGWCTSLVKIDLTDVVMKILDSDNGGELSVDYFDKVILSRVTEDTINIVIQNTMKYLRADDRKKYEQAFKLYLDNCYYSCAILLASIIDSLSIRRSLSKIQNANDGINVSQCWKEYGKCIQDIYGFYFSNEFPFKNNKNDSRVNNTISFFDSIRKDYYYDNNIYKVVSLTFALLKFFEDSNWKDLLNEKIPSSINRHWLAHGMYSVEDINKVDCVKLLLMLEQLVELYSN